MSQLKHEGFYRANHTSSIEKAFEYKISPYRGKSASSNPMALQPPIAGYRLDVMMELAREGMTMVVVSHEMGFARAAANRIVFMDGGQIIEAAPPDVLFKTPCQERTKQFLSKVLHL